MTRNPAKLTLGGLALLLSASAAPAQTTPTADECEKLKVEVAKLEFENANLRKGLLSSPEHQLTLAATGAQTAPVAAPAQRRTVQKVELALAKCEGNAKIQTVTVTLLLTNAGANRDLQYGNVKAVDNEGEQCATYDIRISVGGASITWPPACPPRRRSSFQKFCLLPRLLSCYPARFTTTPARAEPSTSNLGT
ncbi:MAG: hypothetical protein ACRYFR_10720 [Janthinobacterium lividum]